MSKGNKSDFVFSVARDYVFQLRFPKSSIKFCWCCGGNRTAKGGLMVIERIRQVVVYALFWVS